MVGDEDLAVFVAVEAAAEFADRFGGFQKGLGGNGADADDEFGAQDFELPLEEGAAVIDLGGERVAILGRAALEDVHDVNVGPLPATGFDDLGEKLPRSADERLTLAVFVGAGGFAKEHDAGAGVADAKDRLLAAAGQFAAELAGPDVGA